MKIITLKSFGALVKREYWENKGSMLTTPAIMALIFMFFFLIASFTGNTIEINHGDAASAKVYQYLPNMMVRFEQLDENTRSKGIQLGLYAPLAIFGFVMLLISIFYSLGSLYDERRDKSILFWKSLPISDTATVLSKFFVVCVLIPFLYFLVIATFQLVSLIYATVVIWFSGSLGGVIWLSTNIFKVLFNSLFSLIAASLWLAPLWAWLFLASSWAKKVAFLWGGLPIFMIAIAELWILRSSYFIGLISERVKAGYSLVNSNMNYVVEPSMFDGSSIRWWDIFSNGEFWYGLIVSGILLSAAIYTRGYRNE